MILGRARELEREAEDISPRSGIGVGTEGQGRAMRVLF